MRPSPTCRRWKRSSARCWRRSGGSITAAHIQGVLQRPGIAAEVMPKVKLAAGGPNGRVSVLVSSGEAEMGLQQVSEQPAPQGACRTKPWMRG